MVPLPPWMTWLLRVAGGYNIFAGLGMIGFYHEGFRALGVPKPALALPVQVMGILVALFGVGYLMVASRPRENRGILLLGFWSKALSTILAAIYVFAGPLPAWFLLVLFFSDAVWLLPFYVILVRLYGMGRGN